MFWARLRRKVPLETKRSGLSARREGCGVSAKEGGVPEGVQCKAERTVGVWGKATLARRGVNYSRYDGRVGGGAVVGWIGGRVWFLPCWSRSFSRFSMCTALSLALPSRSGGGRQHRQVGWWREKESR